MTDLLSALAPPPAEAERPIDGPPARPAMDWGSRTPEEWLRHAQSLRDAARDGRLLAEGLRQAADKMLRERIGRRRVEDDGDA